MTTGIQNILPSRPILSAAKCRPMIAVSKNIRYMWIFVGVPRGVDIKYTVCGKKKPLVFEA